MTETQSPTPNTLAPHGVWIQILILAWPALAQQGLLLIIQLWDQYLTGPYSSDKKAALTTANYLYWFCTNYAVIVNAGATALVGRLIGSHDRLLANKAMGQSLLLAGGFGLLATMLTLLGLPTFIGWLNLHGNAADWAVRYLTPLAILLPCYMIEMGGIACLVGAGDTRTGLKVLATVVLLNVPLAWGCSTGWGPFPDLGFVGIAVGTAISHLLGCLLVIWTLIRGRFDLQLNFGLLKPNVELIRRLLRVSLPAAFDSLSIGFFQFVFLSMINNLGEVAGSAHGIAIRLEAFGYLSGIAFAIAAAALVGRSLGARRPDLAAQAGWVALTYAGGMMAFMGILFFTFARPMFRIFCPDQGQVEVIDTGVPVLQLVAFAMPGLAATIVLQQLLRAAGDTRFPVLFTWAGFLGVRLPLAYLLTLPSVGLGLFGAWLAMFVDIYVRGAFFVWRFASGNWQRVKV